MEHDFDLLTIGAGSGGVAASRRAAMHGARVAIVEGSRVGGTCVIRGCVPKKLLMYAAQHGEAFGEAAGYGWAVETPPRFEMARWARAKAAETTRLEGIYRQLLAGAKVELVEGWARLDGPNAVVVDTPEGERRLRARHILIATGSSALRDTIPGIEHCATSDDLLDLQQLPERAAIVGAGYIALEFASILARLGVRVALFYRGRLPLRGFDDDLRTRVASALQTAGIDLHPGAAPRRVQRLDDGFLLELPDERVLEFPWVLNATGRAPNTAALRLDRAGVARRADGAIEIDERMRTSVDSIHAIGDVTNRHNLTPVAIAEGRALADTLFGGMPTTLDLSRVASAVFTIPPIGSIGPSEAVLEAEAREQGWRLRVYQADFRPMRAAFVGGPERSFMKLLVDDRTDQVRAVHMLGADAPEIVQSLAVALTAGATKAQFDRTIAVHPTAAEEFVLMREPVRIVGHGT